MLLFLPQNAEDREQKSSQCSSSLEMRWWFCVRYCLPLPSRPLYIQLENVGGGKGVGRIAVVYSIYTLYDVIRFAVAGLRAKTGSHTTWWNLTYAKTTKNCYGLSMSRKLGYPSLSSFFFGSLRGCHFPIFLGCGIYHGKVGLPEISRTFMYFARMEVRATSVGHNLSISLCFPRCSVVIIGIGVPKKMFHKHHKPSFRVPFQLAPWGCVYEHFVVQQHRRDGFVTAMASNGMQFSRLGVSHWYASAMAG